MSELLQNPNFWYAVCIIVIIAIALAVVKNHLKKLASGQIPIVGIDHVKSEKVADKDKSHYPYELTLNVVGMNCADCATRVENKLNRLEGVWAQADVYTRKVTILFQKKADADRFCHDIEAIHPYQVVKVKEHRRTI